MHSRQIRKSLNAIKQEFEGEKKIAEEKNMLVGFNGYKKAIDLADVVILATPPGFRPLHFKYAIDQDKHVFMEKPVATDAHGVRQVLETAKVANQKLNVVVGLQRRYQYSYLNILKQVRRGVIGKITSGQVRWNGAGVWVREERAVEVRKLDHGEIFDHHFVEFKYASGATISSQCRHQPGTHRHANELLVGTKGKVNILIKELLTLKIMMEILFTPMMEEG